MAAQHNHVMKTLYFCVICFPSFLCVSGLVASDQDRLYSAKTSASLICNCLINKSFTVQKRGDDRKLMDGNPYM